MPKSVLVENRLYLKFKFNSQVTGVKSDIAESQPALLCTQEVIDIAPSTTQQEEKKRQGSDDLEFEMSNPQEIWSNGKANRRTKERKISFVIEKVSMWRKLYNGIPGKEQKLIRYSLEDSAKKVGISKKSLDDYLLQLRYGKKYDFDFNKHQDDKIGIL